jgi:hypothetical protein
MVDEDKPKFHASSRPLTAITFLMIGIITTGTLFAFPLVLSQNHTATFSMLFSVPSSLECTTLKCASARIILYRWLYSRYC